MDDFKKGIELFAIGVALVTATFAFWTFFASRVETPFEHAVTTVYVLLVGSPLIIVAGMSFGASFQLLFPESKKMYYYLQSVLWIAVIGLLVMIWATDHAIVPRKQEAPTALSYGLYAIQQFGD